MRGQGKGKGQGRQGQDLGVWPYLSSRVMRDTLTLLLTILTILTILTHLPLEPCHTRHPPARGLRLAPALLRVGIVPQHHL